MYFCYEDCHLLYNFDSSITVSKDGRRAIPFTVSVMFCSGCNQHGNCTNKTRSDSRETEYFKYLQCDCQPQYEGEFAILYCCLAFIKY